MKSHKTRNYEDLINPVIRLLLVAASRVFSNSKILEDKLREVIKNITKYLNIILKAISTAKMRTRIFNLRHKVSGKFEIQVRYKLSRLVLSIVIV